MATNTRFTNVSTITLQVPSGTAPGDPVMIGAIKGIAEACFDSSMKAVSATTNGNGYATIRLPNPGTIVLASILASTDDTSSPLGGASAVALGDLVRKNASSELLSKDASGAAFGIALGLRGAATGGYATGTHISAGATASIEILLFAGYSAGS